jgi:hypothetical protein
MIYAKYGKGQMVKPDSQETDSIPTLFAILFMVVRIEACGGKIEVFGALK